MKNLLFAARGLLADVAATLLFLAVNLVSGRVVLAIEAGIALAIVQIGWHLMRREQVTALQWVSLMLVIGSGGASLWTHDPRFVMAWPSLVYLAVGTAMLQQNWMARYMPRVALQLLPDLIVGFGYVWAGLMFVSALVNIVLVLAFNPQQWAALLTGWGIASKSVLFLGQYTAMRLVGRRRWRVSQLTAA